MKKLLTLCFALALTLTAFGSGSSDDKTIKVGASIVPHAEILNEVKDDLKEKGYDLEVVEFTDYVQPNLSLDSVGADTFANIIAVKRVIKIMKRLKP